MKPKAVDIEQGNILNPKEVNQLKLGMHKQEVRDIVGDPILSSAFDKDVWSYVYTNQKNGGKITKKKVILYFKNDKLKDIERDEPSKQTTNSR